MQIDFSIMYIGHFGNIKFKALRGLKWKNEKILLPKARMIFIKYALVKDSLLKNSGGSGLLDCIAYFVCFMTRKCRALSGCSRSGIQSESVPGSRNLRFKKSIFWISEKTHEIHFWKYLEILVWIFPGSGFLSPSNNQCYVRIQCLHQPLMIITAMQ